MGGRGAGGTPPAGRRRPAVSVLLPAVALQSELRRESASSPPDQGHVRRGSGCWSGCTLTETVSSLREGSRVQLRLGGVLPERLLQGRGLCQRHAAAPARQPGEHSAGCGGTLPCLSSPRWPVGTGTEGSLESRGGSPAVALAPSLLHPDFEVPSAGSGQSSWHLHLRILKTPSTHNTVSLSPNIVF